MGGEVGLRLILLEVVALGAREHAPVEMANRVARHIRPVMGELRAEAAQRALVHADADSLNDFAGDQLQGADALEGFRIKILSPWRGVACYRRAAHRMVSPPGVSSQCRRG